RDLHRSARILHSEHDGAFPRNASELTRLPGFGRYTTNAVLSQAFDLSLPILEANSRRVLCRLLGERGDPRTGDVERSLWDAAAALLPRQRSGDFNQALMELGALVCTPEQPACARCPLRRSCIANRDGLQAQIPPSAPRRAPTQVSEVAIVLRQRDEVLVVQRP